MTNNSYLFEIKRGNWLEVHLNTRIDVRTQNNSVKCNVKKKIAKWSNVLSESQNYLSNTIHRVVLLHNNYCKLNIDLNIEFLIYLLILGTTA